MFCVHKCMRIDVFLYAAAVVVACLTDATHILKERLTARRDGILAKYIHQK